MLASRHRLVKTAPETVGLLQCPACNREPPDGSRFCPYCGGKFAQVPKRPADPLIGKVIDQKFEILERIGTGAMGSIYKARHRTLQKIVALKVLHRHLVAEEGHLHRFHREARAASRLNHPNAITILDFGQTEDGWSFIAMEYLSGKDLCRVLFEDGALPPQRVRRLTVQILAALDEAHAAGVVHRDLKPENIMIANLRSESDFVKVLDFGIAKIRDTGGSNKDSSFRTATGMVFGTPEYMSPEQIRGEELDGRSDLYALGVLMYQMLSGNLPFAGESILEVATAHLSLDPPPLAVARPDLPPEVIQVVNRLLAKKRADRYASAVEAKAAVEEAFLKVEPAVGDRGQPSGERQVPLAGTVAERSPSGDATRILPALEADTIQSERVRKIAWTRWAIGALVVLSLAGLTAWILVQVQ
jgi:serine/threonine-protein kinase